MMMFLKNLLFTLFVPGTVAVIIPLLISGNARVSSCWLLIPGLLLLTAGFVIYSWCVWDFATFGRGTPAPIDAPKHLVIRGLYRYSRNPMYIGVLSVILAWGLLYTDLSILVYWICIATCFQFFILVYEEPMLQQLFDIEYAEYRTSVNRWIPDF